MDRSRIVVGGGSAGGMIAVNLCYMKEWNAGEWDRSGVVGLVNLWGSPRPDWSFYEVNPEDPPALIVHGTQDAAVAFSNALDLVKELESQGVARTGPGGAPGVGVPRPQGCGDRVKQ